MANWDHYFHFAAGTRFSINGPSLYNGKGSVIENSGNRLAVRVDLDAFGPAPAIHAVITVEYRQEGPGNLATVEKDGAEPQRYDDVSIISDDGKRERTIAAYAVKCTVRFDGKNEVDCDVTPGPGQSYDFDLKKE
jgi:hypothetical protein